MGVGDLWTLKGCIETTISYIIILFCIVDRGAKFGDCQKMNFGLAVLSVGINVLALLLPLALLQVYDRILPNQSAGTAAVVFSAVAVALLLSGFLRAVRMRIFSRISATSDYQNWTAIAQNLLGRKTKFDEARLLLDTPVKARDAEAGQARVGLYDAPFAFIFLVLIWFLGGRVVLAPLVVICVVTLAFLMWRSSDVRARSELAQFNAAFQTMISRLSFGESSALHAIGAPLSAASAGLRQRAKAIQETENTAGRQLDLMQTAGLATTVLVVGFGAAQVLSGEMTTGGLAACTLLGSRAASQGIGAFVALGRRSDARRAASIVSELGQRQEEESVECLKDAANALAIDEINGGDILVLDGASRQDEAKALASLVSAVWGQVGSVDGAVLVSARPRFLRGTLMENLSGFHKRSEPDALQLAKGLGLDAMIGRLSQGYQTSVSRTEAGGLSPGGVKRALIAQALVQRPKLVVLERPAAGLDVDGRDRLAVVLKSHCPETVVIMTTSAQTLVDIATRHVKVGVAAKTLRAGV
ncbi:hypothetical protein [Tropicibacter sp. Alg240-R139]|uniref:hypothetical protein n=1 Tax=Tropicibacter sp. Alg240-R139 TaxID=2305991 RepID=UPI0013DF033A|nr:hypothetical protein [Tropicibacter sp. Alg240-R139]